MNIFDVLSLIGGLSLFLFGMNIMGQNIGTCATAMISSVGANKNAKRTVWRPQSC